MMNNFDEDAFVREIEHSQMMFRNLYRKEVIKRIERMARNEAHANKLLVESMVHVNKEAIRARNHQSILSEQLRKERLNEEFIKKIRQMATLFAIAIIAYVSFK